MTSTPEKSRDSSQPFSPGHRRRRNVAVIEMPSQKLSSASSGSLPVHSQSEEPVRMRTHTPISGDEGRVAHLPTGLRSRRASQTGDAGHAGSGSSGIPPSDVNSDTIDLNEALLPSPGRKWSIMRDDDFQAALLASEGIIVRDFATMTTNDNSFRVSSVNEPVTSPFVTHSSPDRVPGKLDMGFTFGSPVRTRTGNKQDTNHGTDEPTLPVITQPEPVARKLTYPNTHRTHDTTQHRTPVNAQPEEPTTKLSRTERRRLERRANKENKDKGKADHNKVPDATTQSRGSYMQDASAAGGALSQALKAMSCKNKSKEDVRKMEKSSNDKYDVNYGDDAKDDNETTFQLSASPAAIDDTELHDESSNIHSGASSDLVRLTAATMLNTPSFADTLDGTATGATADTTTPTETSSIMPSYAFPTPAHTAPLSRILGPYPMPFADHTQEPETRKPDLVAETWRDAADDPVRVQVSAGREVAQDTAVFEWKRWQCCYCGSVTHFANGICSKLACCHKRCQDHCVVIH